MTTRFLRKILLMADVRPVVPALAGPVGATDTSCEVAFPGTHEVAPAAYGTMAKPATPKCPSRVSASVMSRSLMTVKLTASVSEKS